MMTTERESLFQRDLQAEIGRAITVLHQKRAAGSYNYNLDSVEASLIRDALGTALALTEIVGPIEALLDMWDMSADALGPEWNALGAKIDALRAVLNA